MVTVGVNPVIVEFDLAVGRIRCPKCSGRLFGWGWARRREVHGVGCLRPRRGRCQVCKSTHVLLPVSVLSRRAYSAQIVVEALTLRARGWGHRKIGEVLGVPVTTVRGWIRRMGTRLDEVRAVFRVLGVQVLTGRPAPREDDGRQSLWQQMINALHDVTKGLAAQLGWGGGVVMLEMAQVAAALSGGHLLSPKWPGVVLAPFQHELALM